MAFKYHDHEIKLILFHIINIEFITELNLLTELLMLNLITINEK